MYWHSEFFLSKTAGKSFTMVDASYELIKREAVLHKRIFPPKATHRAPLKLIFLFLLLFSFRFSFQHQLPRTNSQSAG